ncbi:MAG: hypothetical protein KIG81_04080 [Thermoguttaceae bacterium]|nr:hypothetical protein [Thermoguttaceae bacterium]
MKRRRNGFGDGNDWDFAGGSGRVDVCKANRHSYKNAMTKSFVNAVAPRDIRFTICRRMTKV